MEKLGFSPNRVSQILVGVAARQAPTAKRREASGESIEPGEGVEGDEAATCYDFPAPVISSILREDVGMEMGSFVSVSPLPENNHGEKEQHLVGA